MLYVMHTIVLLSVLPALLPPSMTKGGSMLTAVEKAALLAIPFVEVVCSFAMPYRLPGLPFLPLMTRSVFCALGVSYSFILMGWLCWSSECDELLTVILMLDSDVTY